MLGHFLAYMGNQKIPKNLKIFEMWIYMLKAEFFTAFRKPEFNRSLYPEVELQKREDGFQSRPSQEGQTKDTDDEKDESKTPVVRQKKSESSRLVAKLVEQCRGQMSVSEVRRSVSCFVPVIQLSQSCLYSVSSVSILPPPKRHKKRRVLKLRSLKILHTLPLTSLKPRGRRRKSISVAQISTESKNTSTIKSKRISCSACSKEFSNERALSLHMRPSLQHDKNWHCSACLVNFYNENCLRFHKDLVHKAQKKSQAVSLKAKVPKAIGRVSCEICEKVFTRRAGLFYHRRQVHQMGASIARKFKCTECEKSFIKRSHLTLHNQTHTGQNLFPCRFCLRSFPGVTRRRMHEQKVHGGDGGTLSAEEVERNHVAASVVSTNAPPVSEVRRPKSKGPPTLHTCSFCPKTFILPSAKISHERKHTGEKPFLCGTCGNAYKSAASLQEHDKVVHRLQNDLLCPKCGLAFGRHMTLKYHILSKHTERQFPCLQPGCNRVFIRKPALEKHMRGIHAKGFIQCTLCNYKVTSSQEMSAHLHCHEVKRRRAAGLCRKRRRLSPETIARRKLPKPIRVRLTPAPEKKLQCAHCEKRFAFKNDLINHTKALHTGERDFKCSLDTCPKAFVTKYKLLVHQQRAHGIPYQKQLSTLEECPVCQKSLRGAARLAKHISSRHPEFLSEKSTRPIIPSKDFDHNVPLVKSLQGPSGIPHAPTHFIHSHAHHNSDERYGPPEHSFFTDHHSHFTNRHATHFLHPVPPFSWPTTHSQPQQTNLVGFSVMGSYWSAPEEQHVGVPTLDLQVPNYGSDVAPPQFSPDKEQEGPLTDTTHHPSQTHEDDYEAGAATPPIPSTEGAIPKRGRGRPRGSLIGLTRAPLPQKKRAPPREPITEKRPKVKRQLPCHLCGKIFGTNQHLRDHLGVHEKRDRENEHNHKCAVCGKTFTYAHHLLVHSVIHDASIKPYKCTVPGCAAAFHATKELRKHRDTHPDIFFKRFRCRLCAEVFQTVSELATHRKRRHVETLHACTQPGCTYAAVNTSLLIRHASSHMEKNARERPFKCNLCSCSYLRGANLQQHLDNMHQGAGSSNPLLQPLKCPTCTKEFQFEWRLKDHVARSHLPKDKVRPRKTPRPSKRKKPLFHFCADCDWSFASAAELKRHVKREHGESPLSCLRQGCDVCFFSVSLWGNHLRTQHAPLTEDEEKKMEVEETRQATVEQKSQRRASARSKAERRNVHVSDGSEETSSVESDEEKEVSPRRNPRRNSWSNR